jgi:hypothetical protein
MSATPTASERLDAVEAQMSDELDRVITRSVLYTSGERDPSGPMELPFGSLPPGKYVLQGADPRLKKMPAKPTLLDFFKYRIGPANHLLQSAKHALRGGHPEHVVLACLLHDIAVMGFIRSDHGYWGAQLLEPYVTEEVSWAIRAHQSLRFFPDEAVGYSYPEHYIRIFGPDYQPEPYIVAEYERFRKHKWYMTARLICLNDIYSFDPNVIVELDEFEDIIGRNFRQPEEGLGFDNTPSSHMWRTMMWPTRFL